jgi:hypothetical protein
MMRLVKCASWVGTRQDVTGRTAETYVGIGSAQTLRSNRAMVATAGPRQRGEPPEIVLHSAAAFSAAEVAVVEDSSLAPRPCDRGATSSARAPAVRGGSKTHRLAAAPGRSHVGAYFVGQSTGAKALPQLQIRGRLANGRCTRDGATT